MRPLSGTWLKAENLFSSYFISTLFLTCLLVKWFVLWMLNHPAGITSSGVSLATIENINIQHRVHVFNYAILAFLALFTGINQLMLLLKNRLHNEVLKNLNILSLIGLSLMITGILGNETQSALTFITIVTGLYTLGNLFKFKTGACNNSFLIFLFIASLSFSFLTRELLLFLNHNEPVKYFFEIYFAFFIIGWIAFYKVNISITRQKQILLPLLLMPLCVVLSDEIYLIFNQHNIQFLSPEKLYGLMLLALLLLFTFIRLRKRSFQIKYRTILLLFILVICCFAFYRPILDQPADVFELANPANGIMRLFRFQEIPVLQALGSHMLSEQFFGYIYCLINGYDGTCSFLIYNFLNKVLASLVCFYFFRKIFQSALKACILTLFFPFMGIVAFYPLVYITIFLLYDLQKDASLKKHLFVLGYSLFLIVWRLDIGYANIIAVMLYLFSNVIIHFNKYSFYNLLKSSAFVILSLLCAFGLFTLLDPQVYSNLKQALVYFGASQEHGLPLYSQFSDRYFFFHHIIIPLIILLFIIFLVVKSKVKTFLEIAIIFLGLAYLSNFPRGLVRHSLMIGGDWSLASYAYLSIPLVVIYLYPKNMFNVFWIAATCLILLVKYPLEADNQSLFDQMMKAYTMPVEITGTNCKVERTRGAKIFRETNFGSLSGFVDANLKKDETFIDFSNSPMLYFYLQKPVPSYFNQYMQNTITPYLQQKNLKDVRIEKSPLVIFSNIPETWFDNTDGIPNPLRYSVTAQYIYDNYYPLAIIDKRLIWGRKNRSFQLPAQNEMNVDSIFIPVNYKLGYYPSLLSKEKRWAPNGKITGDVRSFSLPDKLSKSFLCVTISISSPSVKTGLIHFSDKAGVAGNYSFTIIKGENIDYTIPLYVQYNFHRKQVREIEIDIPGNGKINSHEFVYFQPQ